MSSKLIVVDGNSIVNRAFYGIMGSRMLQTADGTYTNAVYGFLAILFKELDDVKPDHIAVAFDLKAPTARHKMYEGYKAQRKGMPDELASQMPILKSVLQAMNIPIIEKEGYEADDILGTLSRKAEKEGLDVVLLTGDRDSFQLATEKTKIHLPRTKAGKTETEVFDREKIKEVYGLEPKQMIEVKGLQGDTSDNIPGVPGIGEKTALALIQEYGDIDSLYKSIDEGKDNLKGKQREKIIEGKDLAYLSKTLGTINLETPIDYSIDDLSIKEWNKSEVLRIFKELRFNRYIERFDLDKVQGIEIPKEEQVKIEFTKKEINVQEFESILNRIEEEKIFYFAIDTKETSDSIIKKKINNISIYRENENTVYAYRLNDISQIKDILENKDVLKVSYDLKEVFILSLEAGIEPKNMMFDIRIAGYLLNSTTNLYSIEDLMKGYMGVDVEIKEEKQKQMTLFDQVQEEGISEGLYNKAYCIGKLKPVLEEELKKSEMIDLFNTIEMPVLEVLADMQYRGIFIDKDELISYGNELKEKIDELTKSIYSLAGEEFNINSPKQLRRNSF